MDLPTWYSSFTSYMFENTKNGVKKRIFFGQAEHKREGATFLVNMTAKYPFYDSPKNHKK